MRLFEFDEDNSLRIKLTAVTSQLQSRIEDTGYEKPFSKDSLLNLLKRNGIALSGDELMDMIKKAPLKNIIGNIQGDDVIFKGQEPDSSDEEMDKETDKETVKSMAKKANKIGK
jgi:hypothetical protein